MALEDAEPRLMVNAAESQAACRRLGVERFAALGIASSDAWKKWAPERFAELAAQLLASGWPMLVLLGGSAEQEEAAAILALLDPAVAGRVRPVIGWNLREVAALLAAAGFYVGNDTAVLNIAAAVGTRSYGLFGGTPVLRHSQHIVPIVPPGGPDPAGGMERIGVDLVLDAIALQG